jgi:hypothetical protein
MGKLGCFQSGFSFSAVATCLCQNRLKKSGKASPGCTYGLWFEDIVEERDKEDGADWSDDAGERFGNGDRHAIYP